MAYITKRGSSYSVRYTYQDEHGKSCDKWESFPTKEEAVKRQKQIEHELATGNFLIPSTVTVAVLPEAEDVVVEINEKDLKIDTYRSGGAGGQQGIPRAAIAGAARRAVGPAAPRA